MKYLVTIILSLLLLLGLAGCNQSKTDANANTEKNPPVDDTAMQAESDGQDAISVILNSFSTKTFAEKEVNPEDIELILKSGAKAPSARNTQPWHFTVITNAEMISKLGGVPGTVFIVISGSTEEMVGVDPTFDCALATQNMYIAAQALGLGAHIYAGPVAQINANEKENLRIPEGYDAISLMCIGYIENELDAITSATPRNELSDIVNYVDDTMAITPTEQIMGGSGGRPANGDGMPQEDFEATLEQDIKDGKITQEQADEISTKIQSGDMQQPNGDGTRPPNGGDMQPPDGEGMQPSEGENWQPPNG